jgi:hypothetical protein
MALALSASCAFVYSFGCALVAFGDDAELAIDWGERAIRLSPLDAVNYIPLGHRWVREFKTWPTRRRWWVARQRALQLNPGFSLCTGWLVAPLAKPGRIEEVNAASACRLDCCNAPSASESGYWCRLAETVAGVSGSPR